jgi:hypothetical protein
MAWRNKIITKHGENNGAGVSAGGIEENRRRNNGGISVALMAA